MLARLRIAAALLVLAAPVAAQTPTITDLTKTFERRDGYFPVYWDGAKGRLFLEVRLGEDFLYLPSLATGLGDASLGLDRGSIGDEQIGRFERVGPKVQLVLQNPRFRAVSDNEALARSVRESFPLSTVASWDVAAEEGGRVLVDATAYATSDITDVRGSLRTANQGTFALDRDKSAVYLAHTKGFPDNTEIETTLTFTSDNPGARVRRHTPDGRALTVRQHLSLVRLPAPGFRSRPFDPRMGSSRSASTTSPSRSHRTTSRATRFATGCRSGRRARRPPSRSSRSCTTWTPGFPSRTDRRSRTARPGGRRCSRRPAS